MRSGNGLLTPLQKDVLALLVQLPDQEQFYLTGGTSPTKKSRKRRRRGSKGKSGRPLGCYLPSAARTAGMTSCWNISSISVSIQFRHSVH